MPSKATKTMRRELAGIIRPIETFRPCPERLWPKTTRYPGIYEFGERGKKSCVFERTTALGAQAGGGRGASLMPDTFKRHLAGIGLPRQPGDEAGAGLVLQHVQMQASRRRAPV